MAYPRFRLSRAHKTVIRTSGVLTVAVAAWTDLDTGGGLDIALPARVGDDIEVFLDFVWGNEATSGAITVATRVSGAVVNRFGGTFGIASGYTDGGRFQAVTAHGLYTAQAGDLASGKVLLRPQFQAPATASRTITADGNYPLRFTAKNLGPAAS